MLIKSYSFDVSFLSNIQDKSHIKLFKEIEDFLLKYSDKKIATKSYKTIKEFKESLTYLQYGLDPLEDAQDYIKTVNFLYLLDSGTIKPDFFKDIDFNKFYNEVIIALNEFSRDASVLYASDEWNIDIVSYFDEILNAVDGKITLDIFNDYVIMPNAVKIERFTPTTEQSQFLECLDYSYYDESVLGEVVSQVRKLNGETLKGILPIAQELGDNYYDLSKYIDNLILISAFETGKIQDLTHAIQVLNQAWSGSNEELIEAAKLLIE